MPWDLAEGWARDPTWKNTTALVGQGAAHHICKQLPGEHRKAERGFAWGSSLSRTPSNTERAAGTTTTTTTGSKDEGSVRLKKAPEAAPCQRTVAPAAGRAPLGRIQSSCMAGSHAGSSSSRRPAARTSGLMHLYLGTSLPEIVKLEQVQSVAANAIKSWSESGGEVERAEPARLAKPWGGRSCPRAPQERRHQGGG